MTYLVQKNEPSWGRGTRRLLQHIRITRKFAWRPRPEVGDFLAVLPRVRRTIPFVSSVVAAGFPSPADDYLDPPLDLNEFLIANPAATFAARVDGDSMIGAGIFPGDIVLVDRSQSPTDGSVILAMVDEEFTLKRYRRRGGKVWLQAENLTYKDIPIAEDMTFEVVGVVHKSIRML